MNCSTTDLNVVPSQESYSVTNHYQKIDDYNIYYGLAVPTDYDAATDKLPLVVALHFGGTPSTTYGKDFPDILIVPALTNLRAIMVAPVSPTAGSWTSSACTEIIFSLIDELKSEYSIDTSKIVLTGFSMGGIGTWYHASKNPEKFSAAIAIAARPDQSSKEKYANTSLPMYVIHSTGDEIFPYEDIETLVQELQDLGSDITLNTVKDISHYQTAFFSGALGESVDWLEERWMKRDEGSE